MSGIAVPHLVTERKGIPVTPTHFYQDSRAITRGIMFAYTRAYT